MTNREQFLLDRKSGIGGSDAAAVVGLSPYATPVELYLDKTGQLQDNTTPQQEAIFERGHVLEPLLKMLFQANYGFKVIEAAQATHNEYSYIVGHVDGLVPEDKAIVEFKTNSSFSNNVWGDELTDNIPKHYLMQVHHYLLIHDTCEKVYVPVLSGTNDMLKLLTSLVKKFGADINLFSDVELSLKLYIVHRDGLHDKLSKLMYEKYDVFWNEHVIPRIPPKWSTCEDIKLLFPEAKNSEVVADEESMKAIENIKQKKAAIEALEADIEKDKAVVCDRLKDASKLVNSEGKSLVGWFNTSRKSFDVEALKKEYGEAMVGQFYKTTNSRAFKVY